MDEPSDHGFMYQRSIEDPDGNILEFFFMEPQAVEQGPDAFLAGQHPEAAGPFEVPEP